MKQSSLCSFICHFTGISFLWFSKSTIGYRNPSFKSLLFVLALFKMTRGNALELKMQCDQRYAANEFHSKVSNLHELMCAQNFSNGTTAASGFPSNRSKNCSSCVACSMDKTWHSPIHSLASLFRVSLIVKYTSVPCKFTISSVNQKYGCGSSSGSTSK